MSQAPEVFIVRSIYIPDDQQATRHYRAVTSMPHCHLALGWVDPRYSYDMSHPQTVLFAHNLGKLYQLKVALQACASSYLWWLDHDIIVPQDLLEASFWTHLKHQTAYGIFYLAQQGNDARVPSSLLSLPAADLIGDQPIIVLTTPYQQQQVPGGSFILTRAGQSALKDYLTYHHSHPHGYVQEEPLINQVMVNQHLLVALLPNMSVLHED